jgi:hypothetical protein
MSRVFLNTAAIKAAFREAETATLEEVGENIAADARHRAPVRKAFREKPGFRRKFRALTESEKRQAIARANNYYRHVNPNEDKRRRAVAHIQTGAARVQIRRAGSANALARSRHLRLLGIESASGRFRSSTGATRRGRGEGFEPGPTARAALTARGRSEARSGESIHREETAHGTEVRIGGALKSSIESEGVVESGTGMKVTVGAFIRYAKFVEFPTIRTAAQPFLLPALHGERERLASLLAANLRKTLGGL